MGRKAESGDTVRVHYTGTLDDGTVFDSSRDGEPLEFVLGDGQVIEGFEEALLGMSEGESREVELPPEKAYGERSDELVISVDRSELPEDLDPEVGQTLAVDTGDEEEMAAWVAEVGEDAITVDLNHPLAGRTLNFEVKLVALPGG
jgi:peptidylprolyl isomerase